MVLLVPPLRFSVAAANPQRQPESQSSTSNPAETTLYRGAYPRQRHLPFLSRLKLKTILSLTPKPLDETITDWAEKQSIRHIHVRCEKPKEEAGGLTRESAAKALVVILDSRNLPLYVHCLDGQDVTSLLIACVRKVQGWSSPSILSELARGTGAVFDLSSQMNFNHSNSTLGPSPADYHVQFVSKFGVSPISEGVRLPSRRWIPDWCWVEPSPLARLRNPYDIGDYESHLLLSWQVRGLKGTPTSAGSRVYHKKDRERKEGEGKKTPNETENIVGTALESLNAQTSIRESTAGESLGDESENVASKSPSPSPSPPPHLHSASHLYLPILHPTIRLRFDADPTLPPAPIPQTPATPMRANTTQSQRSQSRPVSRAGRAPLPGSGSGPSGIGGGVAQPVFQGSERDSRDRDLSHSSSRSDSRPGSAPSSPRRRAITINSSPILYGGLPTSSSEAHPHLLSHTHTHSPLVPSAQMSSPSKTTGGTSSQLGASSNVIGERFADRIQEAANVRRRGGGTTTPPPRSNQATNAVSLGRSSNAFSSSTVDRALFNSWSHGSPTRKSVQSSLLFEDENEGGETSTPRARSVTGVPSSSSSASIAGGASSSRLRSESGRSTQKRSLESSISSSDETSDGEREDRPRRGRENERQQDRSPVHQTPSQSSNLVGIDVHNSNTRISQLRDPVAGESSLKSISNHLGLEMNENETRRLQQSSAEKDPEESSSFNEPIENDDGEGEQTPRRALQNLPSLLSEPFHEHHPRHSRLDYLKSQASKAVTGGEMSRSNTSETSYLETTSSTNSSSIGSDSSEQDQDESDQGGSSPSPSPSRRAAQSSSNRIESQNTESPTPSSKSDWRPDSLSSRRRPASAGYENSYGIEVDHSGLRTSPKSEIANLNPDSNMSQRTRSTSDSLLSASSGSRSDQTSGFSNYSTAQINDPDPSEAFLVDPGISNRTIDKHLRNGSGDQSETSMGNERERRNIPRQSPLDDHEDLDGDSVHDDHGITEGDDEILEEEELEQQQEDEGEEEEEEEEEEEDEEDEEDEESEGEESEGDLLEALDLA